VSDVVGRRVRLFAGLLVLAELIVFVLVASWIGVGWTILATLATSAVGVALLGRQGTRALADLRERARSRQPAGRELGDAGLVAAGGLLMVLPGFIGDLLGLLCLLPGTRWLVRGALTSVVLARLPDRFRGPVRARSVRVEEVGGFPGSGSTRATSGTAPLVIEGEVVREVVRETPPDRPAP
jgi:UPF0716 protein FxsA